MLCARALVRALNDAKNRTQQGCAMEFSGITLICKFKLKQLKTMYCLIQVVIMFFPFSTEPFY